MFKLFKIFDFKQRSSLVAVRYILLSSTIMCVFLFFAKLASYMYKPIQNVYYSSIQSIIITKQSLTSQYHLANHLAHNTQYLEKQLQNLQIQQDKINRLKSENNELKSLLNFTSQKNSFAQNRFKDTIDSSVVTKHHDKNSNHRQISHNFITGKVYKIQCDAKRCKAYVSLEQTAAINKNDVVLSDKGIFGKVLATYPTYVVVQLTTDNKSRIPVRDKDNNKGILAGNSKMKTHKILHLTSNSNRLGKIWYTDAGSSFYRKNIPIAKLTSFSSNQIIAAPIKNYDDVKFVSIMLKSL